jgi:hypothetical protein
MALRAKAKAEVIYRFYALYNKIYREDTLANSYAQCCSNKGAPGVDGQDFQSTGLIYFAFCKSAQIFFINHMTYPLSQ